MTSGSGYRDELETLRARVATLEAALEAAEREPDRIETKLREQRIEALVVEVEAVRGENETLRRAARQRTRRQCSLAAALGFLAGACIVFWLFVPMTDG